MEESVQKAALGVRWGAGNWPRTVWTAFSPVICSMVLVVLFCATASAAASASSPSSSDQAEIRKVLDQYVAAWLAGDAPGVMRLLTEDPILIPGDKAPYIGADAIRQYWWPPASPPFSLRVFTTTIDEITGAPNLAVVRGKQTIEWMSDGVRWRTHGNYIMVLRRADGRWQIAVQMAANAPNERLP